MSTKSQDAYLHQPRGPGTAFYARVSVPRTLVKYVGQSHLRQSLKTTSRAEANLRKHAVVGKLKAELERLRKAPDAAKDRGISFAEAKEWRNELMRAEDAEDHDLHGAVQDSIIGKAEELERLYGTDKAKRWYKAATAPTDTLAELMSKWLEVSEFKASTNAGHRKALAEVLAFVGNDHAVPADIDLKKAIAYIDNDLTQRGLAHNTIRDRLVSLGGFWSWMQSRAAVPRGVNPWSGHRVSKKDNKGRSPEKRAYTDDELLRLLAGNEQVKAWPTYSYIPDLIVLGMFTGCRLDELCSLTAEKVEIAKGHAILNVTDAKTKAGNRPVALIHAAPLAVLKRRMKDKKAGAVLFPELSPGGLDAKMSSSAVKAFGRYRRACGVPDGTDFHSFRRNVATILEHEEAGNVPTARFLGHKLGTESGDTYSAGASKRLAVRTAGKIKHGAKVEKAALALASS